MTVGVDAVRVLAARPVGAAFGEHGARLGRELIIEPGRPWCADVRFRVESGLRSRGSAWRRSAKGLNRSRGSLGRRTAGASGERDGSVLSEARGAGPHLPTGAPPLPTPPP